MFLPRTNFALRASSYVFLHASRKTFSNVKVSISAQWTPSLQNQSLSPDQVASGVQSAQPPDPSALFALICPLFARLVLLFPWQTWEANHLFADEKAATLFLGALDSIFLFSYAVVSGCRASEQTCTWNSTQLGDLCVCSQGLYLSGVIGDRVNLRYVLCFGLCGSATVVSRRSHTAAAVFGTSLL